MTERELKFAIADIVDKSRQNKVPSHELDDFFELLNRADGLYDPVLVDDAKEQIIDTFQYAGKSIKRGDTRAFSQAIESGRIFIKSEEKAFNAAISTSPIYKEPERPLFYLHSQEEMLPYAERGSVTRTITSEFGEHNITLAQEKMLMSFSTEIRDDPSFMRNVIGKTLTNEEFDAFAKEIRFAEENGLSGKDEMLLQDLFISANTLSDAKNVHDARADIIDRIHEMNESPYKEKDWVKCDKECRELINIKVSEENEGLLSETRRKAHVKLKDNNIGFSMVSVQQPVEILEETLQSHEYKVNVAAMEMSKLSSQTTKERLQREVFDIIPGVNVEILRTEKQSLYESLIQFQTEARRRKENIEISLSDGSTLEAVYRTNENGIKTVDLVYNGEKTTPDELSYKMECEQKKIYIDDVLSPDKNKNKKFTDKEQRKENRMEKMKEAVKSVTVRGAEKITDEFSKGFDYTGGDIRR